MKIRELGIKVAQIGALALAMSPVMYTWIAEPTYVREGRLKYAQRPLSSGEFYRCSAVILDTGDSAIYAHAQPAHEPDPWESPRTVCVGNVVSRIIEKAEEEGIDLKKSFAVIHTGVDGSLANLVSDFEKRNIPVKFASSMFCGEGPRKIRYDPLTNELDIRAPLHHKQYVARFE
ncbi:MAG: hypothetical protein ACP5NS_04365 [Candidatus Pacearchaeota archaeon]